MYGILRWKYDERGKDYLDIVKNEDGSVHIFEKLADADFYANSFPSDLLRVISLEPVNE